MSASRWSLGSGNRARRLNVPDHDRGLEPFEHSPAQRPECGDQRYDYNRIDPLGVKAFRGLMSRL